MFSRKNVLLVVGVILATIGCALLFSPVDGEPMWARWLLAPIFLYFGIPLAILGAAIRFFAPLVTNGEVPTNGHTAAGHR